MRAILIAATVGILTATGSSFPMISAAGEADVAVVEIERITPPGVDLVVSNDFTRAGNVVYFVGSTSSQGPSLWKTDGTDSGTVLVKAIAPQQMTPVGDTLYFVANGGELWRSDGTEASTVMVHSLQFGWADVREPRDLTAVGKTLFFTLDTRQFGREVWKTDGTSAGTTLLKDVRPAMGLVLQTSSPHLLTAVGDLLYFVANDGVHNGELWRSDGTEAGTVMVKDINPGGLSGSSSIKSQVQVLGDSLYFVADDGVHGSELWRSDGSEPGTVLVKDINPGTGWGLISLSEPADGKLYMSARGDSGGRALWVSDGTADGTVLVKDIDPAASPDVDPIGGSFLPTRGGVVFAATDPEHGQEMWRTDGTEEGTYVLKDIRPGAEESEIWYGGGTGRATYDGVHYFGADDGIHGYELWRTDGTVEGTYLAKDILPGVASGFPIGFLSHGDLFLMVADDAEHIASGTGPSVLWRIGTRAWAVDVTAPETVIVSGPQANEVVGGRSVTFTFEGTPGDSERYECSIDATTFAPCSAPMVYDVNDGLHTFAVRAIDAAGNVDPSPATRTFSVVFQAEPTAGPSSTSPSPTMPTTSDANATCAAVADAARKADAKAKKLKRKVRNAPPGKQKALKNRAKKAKKAAKTARANKALVCT